MAKKKVQWLMPTNTENLKMIIAQGLISSPDGFTKYYSDIMELVPNYIPLFKNEIQSEALDYVTKEDESLVPVILEIDLKKISKGIKVIKDNELDDLEGDAESEDKLFILAPLPLSVILTLIFPSKLAEKEFKDSLKLYSNVILNDLKLSSNVAEQKLFSVAGQMTLETDDSSDQWINDLRIIDTKDVRNVDYKKVYAYGGLLLNLFYFAKNGKLSNDTYKIFNDFKEEIKNQDIDVHTYFKNIDNDVTDDVVGAKNKMNYGLIDIAINSKDFKEDVIKFLEKESWEGKVKKRTQELSYKLKDFELNTNRTMSEQFKDAEKKPLEKILMMLFLREDTEALMAYTLDLFSEQDYINFAMMFGIRDKFIKAPKELKEFTGLKSYVSLKMAEYAHFIIKSDMKFKQTVKPLTVMDLFNKNNLKKRLIKELKVESCIQTIMPNKEYFSKSGINTYLGFIEPKYEVLEKEYFNILSKRTITKEEYNKFAKMK